MSEDKKAKKTMGGWGCPQCKSLISFSVIELTQGSCPECGYKQKPEKIAGDVKEPRRIRRRGRKVTRSNG